jgi:hypothetical protein
MHCPPLLVRFPHNPSWVLKRAPSGSDEAYFKAVCTSYAETKQLLSQPYDHLTSVFPIDSTVEIQTASSPVRSIPTHIPTS